MKKNIDYLLGYRDALNAVDSDFRREYGYKTEEEFAAVKPFFTSLRYYREAAESMVRAAQRTIRDEGKR